jgi:predicted DNA-binding protein
MSNMTKYNVYYTADQLKRLNKLADKTGLTASEHLRRALDEYLARVERK